MQLRIVNKFRCLLNKRQRKRVVILFFMMLIGAFFEVCGVSLMLPLVTAIMDEDITTKNIYAAKVCALFHIESHIGFVVFCISAIIILYIVKTVYLVFEYYIQYRFIGNNQFITQENLLNTYLHRPYEFFLSAKSGEIVRIVQSDTESTFNMLGMLLMAASETVIALALLLTVFIVSPMITGLVTFVMAIMMFVIAKVVKPILQKQGVLYQKSYAENNKWLLQAVSGIKEIKVTRTEDFFLDKYGQYGRKRVYAYRINQTLQNVPRFLIEAASVCSMLAAIGVMVAGGHSMKSLVPSLGTFVMAAVKLLPSANRIIGAVNQIAYLEPALDNMLANTKGTEKKGISDIQEKENLLTLEHDIKLLGITYTYPGGEKKIFEHADLTIPIGTSIGIVGMSGAGKTTVVDILLGLLKPQEGKILADNVDISTNMQGWLSHIGYIPQIIFMLDGTIRENVVFGYVENVYTDDDVWLALKEAQLADFVRGLPKGLDTTIGERGVRLSGGQRQRIGIARALFANPDVLIFDEATSALDNETEEAIMQSINALHGKKTMIIIAHRLTTIEGCDVIYRAGNGKIVKERG